MKRAAGAASPFQSGEQVGCGLAVVSREALSNPLHRLPRHSIFEEKLLPGSLRFMAKGRTPTSSVSSNALDWWLVSALTHHSIEDVRLASLPLDLARQPCVGGSQSGWDQERAGAPGEAWPGALTARPPQTRPESAAGT